MVEIFAEVAIEVVERKGSTEAVWMMLVVARPPPLLK
jgi:hypothetical protein